MTRTECPNLKPMTWDQCFELEPMTPLECFDLDPMTPNKCSNLKPMTFVEGCILRALLVFSCFLPYKKVFRNFDCTIVIRTKMSIFQVWFVYMWQDPFNFHFYLTIYWLDKVSKNNKIGWFYSPSRKRCVIVSPNSCAKSKTYFEILRSSAFQNTF